MGSFTVVISPHWHFDHAWIKTHEQYMDELVVPNFRLLLHLLQKYPTYKCAVEQATQWISLRRIAPDVFQALTTFVQQGRITLVGGQVTSPDVNIPSGESLIRNYFYGKRFLQQTFGMDTQIGWNIDVFGQCAQYPLILSHTGMKYYAWHRGVDDKKFRRNLAAHQPARPPHVLFQWTSLNGKDAVTSVYLTNTYTMLTLNPVELNYFLYFIDVLFHNTPIQRMVQALVRAGDRLWFHAARRVRMIIAEKMLYRQAVDAFRTFPSPRRILAPLGTDFSAPNSYILQLLPQLQARGRSRNGVEWRLATPQEFFQGILLDALSSTSGAFLEGERIFSGVWSTRIKEKQMNRWCEGALFDLEAFATLHAVLAWGQGLPGAYPHEKIDAAWQDLLINQFHDIICGCSIDLVYIDAMERYDHLRNMLSQGIQAELEAIAALVNTQEQKTGESVVLFNPLPWARTGEWRDMIEREIPPLGYCVINPPANSVGDESFSEGSGQGRYLQLEPTCEHQCGEFLFQFESNCLICIKDLRHGQILLEKADNYWVGAVRMVEENGDTYDTRPGRVLEIFHPKVVLLNEMSPNETILELNGALDHGNAEIQEQIKVSHLQHEIEFSLHVKNGLTHIKLEICFPHGKDLTETSASVAFGCNDNPKGLFPTQNWLWFRNADFGFCLVNQGTPEHIYHRPICFVTLLRSVSVVWRRRGRLPRPTPLALEQGAYEYAFQIRPTPRTGNNWPNVENIAAEILHPIRGISQSCHPGPLPPRASILQVGEKLAVSAIKVAHEQLKIEQDPPMYSIILRCFNPFNVALIDDPAAFVRVDGTNVEFEMTNGMESDTWAIHPIAGDNQMNLNLGAFDLATIRISFGAHFVE